MWKGDQKDVIVNMWSHMKGTGERGWFCLYVIALEKNYSFTAFFFIYKEAPSNCMRSSMWEVIHGLLECALIFQDMT